MSRFKNARDGNRNHGAVRRARRDEAARGGIHERLVQAVWLDWAQVRAAVAAVWEPHVCGGGRG